MYKINKLKYIKVSHSLECAGVYSSHIQCSEAHKKFPNMLTMVVYVLYRQEHSGHGKRGFSMFTQLHPS